MTIGKYNLKLIASAFVVLQILLILFWVSRQGSLYWDAYYTLENANSISQANPSEHYIIYDSEFEEGKWLPVEYVVNTMIVDSSEALYYGEPDYILRSLFFKPYTSFLNISEAILSPGVFSRWPAVFLNILFFITTQFLLWKVAVRLSGNEVIAMMAVLLYGFSGMAFSMTTYARFYVFTTMLMTVYTYLHVLMWDLKDRECVKAFGIECLTFLIAYWSMGTSQLTLFYYVIFIVVYCLGLLISKRFIPATIYIVPIVIGGGLFLTRGSDYLWMITHLREAFNSTRFRGPTLWVLDSFLTLNPISFVERLAHMFLLVGRFAFGCWPVCLLFCVIVAYMCIRKRRIEYFHTAIEWIVFISAFLFILLAGGLRFYAQTRYSSYVFPLIGWIIAVVLYDFVTEYPGSIFPKVLSAVVILSVIAFTITVVRVDFV